MMENEATSPEQESARKAALRAAVEAIVYVAEEPVTIDQIAAAVGTAPGNAGGESTRQEMLQELLQALQSLQEEYRRDDRGLEIREIAGGYKMFTKAEHHETIRKFAKSLTPPLKLS